MSKHFELNEMNSLRPVFLIIISIYYRTNKTLPNYKYRIENIFA